MGMFDSVFGCCPHCQQQVELQSKAGDCELKKYSIADIPPEVAIDLTNNFNDFNTICENCDGHFVFELIAPIARVSARLVKKKDQADEEREWD